MSKGKKIFILISAAVVLIGSFIAYYLYKSSDEKVPYMQRTEPPFSDDGCLRSEDIIGMIKWTCNHFDKFKTYKLSKIEKDVSKYLFYLPENQIKEMMNEDPTCKEGYRFNAPSSGTTLRYTVKDAYKDLYSLVYFQDTEFLADYETTREVYKYFTKKDLSMEDKYLEYDYNNHKIVFVCVGDMEREKIYYRILADARDMTINMYKMSIQ